MPGELISGEILRIYDPTLTKHFSPFPDCGALSHQPWSSPPPGARGHGPCRRCVGPAVDFVGTNFTPQEMVEIRHFFLFFFRFSMAMHGWTCKFWTITMYNYSVVNSTTIVYYGIVW